MKTQTLWLCLGFGLLAACGGDKGDSAETEEADADTDADTDTDSDTDADTDADADADANLSINVTADVGGTIYDDVCVGTLTASDDGATVSGTGTCAFAGPLASILAGDQTGVLDGSTDGTAGSGTYAITTSIGAALDLEWTGTSDGTTMTGSFDGSSTIEASGLVVPVDYAGSFTY